ncbi:MAG: DUF4139 domain-containing protein, partial [Armatimonadetes bacterium]|nr:DUF4139 domain-containing protein [Armatimonadota bacterium]
AGPHEAAALPVGETPDVIEANILAAQLQRLELTAADEAIRGSRRAGGDSESLAVDYPMPGQVSLQSRNDQQMFRIAAVELQPSFHYSAVPLLSDFVYRAVEARNTSPLALLPGPYSAYVEGVFAGRGQLPLTASGQGLALGFGTESRLRVTRVLEEKQTAIRGGNKQLRYTYRFRLQNFMDRPATVRVWDRLPQTPSEQVTVALVEPGAKLSEDPLYQEIERPRGLLRWDIEVPAGASGAQAKSFAYTFQLEFDKNYDIGALPAELEERMRRDLQSLQERKAM